MRPVFAARSDVGRVRQGNEDAYLAEQPLFAVADGMGGHLGGEIASATAVETISQAAREDPPHDSARLAAIVRAANAAVWERAQGDPQLRGMGTTCTLALLEGEELHIAHVGDSRAYLYRQRELTQVTDDHTLVNRMVREGRLQPEEADRHPQRSIITRALGVDAEVEVDELTLGVEEGDRVLLCSDGLTSMIDFEELHQLLASESDPETVADRLVEAANAAGGEDNVTVLLIDIQPNGATGSAPMQTVTAPAPAASPVERERTDPDLSPPPPAVDTGVHSIPVASPSQSVVTGERPRRRWPRVLAVTILSLLVLAGAGLAATRYTLANSYFVGVDGAGTVTIYKGIPEDIVGLTLKESAETTTISVEDLPEFIQENVEQGIKADSLEDARDKVADLEQRAQDAEFENETGGRNN
jgi:PPM family protein phosphatase